MMPLSTYGTNLHCPSLHGRYDQLILLNIPLIYNYFIHQSLIELLQTLISRATFCDTKQSDTTSSGVTKKIVGI